LHLHDPAETDGRIHDLWLFGIIGGFVLLLACINFMNLSTARSEKRAKEVGIRKTIGSLRYQLITQFLGESLLTATLAFLLAILLAFLALPGFNALSAKDLTFPWSNSMFWLAAGAFTIGTGLLAGSYPAFYLSSFNPVHGFTRRSGLPRKILVVTQFSISLSLIIATIIIYRQISFTKDRPIGYSRNGLVTVDINSDTLRNHYLSLRNDLLQSGIISNMTAGTYAPDGFWSNNYLTWSGMSADKQGTLFRNVGIDPDFGPTVGWTILRGRNFSRDFPTDSNAMLLNEAALNATGFKNPIGQQVVFRKRTYHIIGIVGNMLTNSPYEKIEPALFIDRGDHDILTLRINPRRPMHAALAALEPYFKRYNPESPFTYYFVDDVYAKKFAGETREGNIAVVLSSFAIFISCLGLFGLASFVAEQRTKEIGIRKILGASVPHLWSLQSKDFLKLTALSMLIAMPLMSWLMHNWLRKYAYHAPMSWWIFASAGAGILLITLLTVSFQSLKAALMNPVISLRNE
jgi:putative ABC transport system permease protein